MKIALFCHSLRSDWDNGNAHFQRGVVSELARRGHAVRVCEPNDAASALQLASELGTAALDGFRPFYPEVDLHVYDPGALDLDAALDGADLVLVHGWTPRQVAIRLAEYRASHRRYRLLFHDADRCQVSTTATATVAAGDLAHYDGVLACGEALRERYRRLGWGSRAWTWHEAADTSLFYPRARAAESEGDLVWLGNSGGDERASELVQYLAAPSRELGLRTRVYGVGFSHAVTQQLAGAGVDCRGRVPNYQVPEICSGFQATVHISRPRVTGRRVGAPSVHLFEALACGIPLVSAPWHDEEGLFSVGRDFLMARDPTDMTRLLATLLQDRELARALAQNGLRTLRARHTCAHRVDELLAICRVLGVRGAAASRRSQAGHVYGWGRSL